MQKYFVNESIELNKTFEIEKSTAKDSNINNNYFGTTNTTIIVDDETGKFPIPNKFINMDPVTPKPNEPSNPVTPNNPETNTTKPTTNNNNTQTTDIPNNNQTDNILNNIVSNITNEFNEIVSNANKIVSNSTESNVNVGTDSSQEATKSSDSEKSVHELLDKDVSKQTQINPIPFIIVLIIVFAVLIFGYYRYKKNE